MNVTDFDLTGVKLIRPRRFADPRGWFAETYSHDRFVQAGIADHFIQDNQSLSRPVGTVRGLHFQLPPYAQAKLVRVVRGRILDIAVDLRSGSPTYGHHVSAVLDAQDGDQLYIPVGFAHGFCTLEPDTEVLYKVTANYAPSHDRGLRWDDPALGIVWPVTAANATVSDKDRALPLLAELPKDLFAS